MRFNADELLNRLIEQTRDIGAFANGLKLRSDLELRTRPDQHAWSVLECLEHLNRYGNYYLREIGEKMDRSHHGKAPYFKSGLVGNYFAESMLPAKKRNKMKTFKSMDPIYVPLDRTVIDTFIDQQREMLALLERAKDKNLNKVRTNISITRLIKIRLGDTFRIVIYHNIRHIEQIKRILSIRD